MHLLCINAIVKGMNPFLFPNYRLNSRINWTLKPWIAASLEGGKFWIQNHWEGNGNLVHYSSHEVMADKKSFANKEKKSVESHDQLCPEKTWYKKWVVVGGMMMKVFAMIMSTSHIYIVIYWVVIHKMPRNIISHSS